jgi:hypothetical protein
LAITVNATGISKVYNGNVTAAVTLASSGVLAGDTLIFSDSSATFADKNVGTGKTVSIAGISASGTGSANYTENATATTAANITPAVVNLSGTRVYDALVDANAGIFSGGTVNGITGENLTLTGSGTLAGKNVGANALTSLGTLALTDGTGSASNYTLIGGTDSATVTTLAIAVTGTAGNKVYDRTTTAVATLSSTGVLAGDSLTFADTSALFASKTAANGKTVTISGITASGTGASNYTVNATTTTTANITPLAITVSGTAGNKVYNGNTTATGVALASSGVIAGDTVTFSKTGATFADQNVGTAKTVSISGISKAGTDSANYTLNNLAATTTANITAAVVTLSSTRVYDGLTDANAAIFGTAGTVNGVAGENLVLTGTGVLAAKNVGSESMSLGSLALGNGTGSASNYTLSGATDSVTVTQLGITVTGTGTNKVYNRNATDAVTLASTGVLSGDSLTFADTSATFADSNVGTAKTVSISGITASGTGSGNYAVNTTAATTANITPLGITVTGTGTNKVYNGNVVDAVTLTGTGVLTGDSLTYSDTSATFTDKNVANGKTVSISGITANGASSGNYTVNSTSTTTANITPLGITVTAAGTNKVYDTTIADAVTLASAGVVVGDVVSFGDTTATFANKNVGTGKTVSVAGITAAGADAGNYTLNNTSTSTTANITPLAITVVGTGINKIYNGTVTDAVSLASSGVLTGDSVTFGDASAVFNNKTVGTGKTVSISGITAGGADAGNYTVNATAATTANVTPLAITVTGTGSNKVYDGTVTDAVTLASAGVLAGDSVTFGDTSAAFNNKSVGTGKSVSISGITASGADSGNYSFNSAAGTTANITPLAITVTGAGSNKVYDGTVADAVTLTSTGVLTGDTVTFGDTTAAFNDKNVGTGKSVSISGITASGADSGNYSFNSAAGTIANITPLAITVTGTGSNKVYDGSVTDAVTLASVGVLAGDSVTFGDTTAVFNDKMVGTGKTVSISGITAGGADAGNYTVNATAATTANITPLAITVTGTGSNKVYDGTATDAVTLASTGVLMGDSVTFGDTTAAFNDKMVGTGKSVSISGITASGADAGNYTVNGTAATTANITPLAITVTGTGSNKVYDGTVTDAVTLASVGVLAGDSVTFGDTSAAFNDKNVGTGKSVSISGISASGADAGNYTLNNLAATTTANITPLGITVTGTGSNKVYDGTAADAVTLASAGVLAGDTLTFADTSAAFDNKDAGTSKTVSISGITAGGTDAGNYTLNGTAATTANITPLAITVTSTGSNKVYDGTVTDAVTLASVGVLAGDTVAFGDTSAAFNDKNVGNGKSVIVSGISASGSDAGNYTVNASATTRANISPATLTETANPANGGGGKLPTLSGTLAGFVLGDTAENSTTGQLVWVTDAPTHPNPGTYSIDGSGLTAANYVIAQAPANADALSITALPGLGIPQAVAGLIGLPIAADDIATPFGVGSSEDYGNNTGNAKTGEDPTDNRYLNNFKGRLALTVVGGAVRLPKESIL